ncbi:hypothetical protein AL755_04740 [Arthrobacter sp. ERGS1:01]|uniref:molybdenum cofactor guanylyltransferase n=1 Tax=Arthrobacter sp. ERGS1:01 TaxID=1704044 RepID=UPI0006B4F288|nr:NTP transferase domain-containing protein [Arthrobacter sp. ERGS1:01]ALE04956.1 hypothetical protein AL755_04740 [Arthrobacter sp. ERGS1:01]
MRAVILCGGRSTRLGGVPKAGLTVGGETLLARTVRAAQAATWPDEECGQERDVRIAVVGPTESIAAWLGPAPDGVLAVQEDPPFAGPAAGIAAGLAALGGTDGHVLVLACDMPRVGETAQALLAALDEAAPAENAPAEGGTGEGVMAVDRGRSQPLAAIYPLAPLREAVAAARAAHRLHNASVFSLLARVNTKDCAVPQGSTADIDTWDDARLAGIAMPGEG